jgi:hypothetical protein
VKNGENIAILSLFYANFATAKSVRCQVDGKSVGYIPIFEAEDHCMMLFSKYL